MRKFEWDLSSAIAKEKGCHRTAIARAARRGKLTSHSVGHCLLIRRDEKLAKWKPDPMRQACSRLQFAERATKRDTSKSEP